MNSLRERKRTAKKAYYNEIKASRQWVVPPVAARRALYDKIYRKTKDGRYIIDGRPSC